MEDEKQVLKHSGFVVKEKRKMKRGFFFGKDFELDFFKPKTDKQKTVRLCIQIGVCALLLISVISLKAIDSPFTNNTLDGINRIVSSDVDIDEDLGRLKFVSEDMVSVFNEDLSLPIEALAYELVDDNRSLVIQGTKNEPVFATFGGKAAIVDTPNEGNSLIIEHESGIKSVYSGVIPTVFDDDTVSTGQAVGYLSDDYLRVNIMYQGDYLKPEEFIIDPIMR